jgi:opine dehydrogenase
MTSPKRITVIGGGNGAFAATVHLTLNGFKVNLCDPYNEGESLRPLLTDDKINYLGVLGQGSVTPNLITHQIETAANDADLFLVCVPSTAHEAMASLLAPVLRPHATVLLNPGHTGGALHFLQAVRKSGFSEKFSLGETNTLTYIARKQDPSTINISNLARNIHVSALPSIRLEAVMQKFKMCYPDLKSTRTVIGTSLRNVNAMMHTPGMILSAAWIEHTGGDFNFYYDAATPAVSRLMHKIDDERLAIAAAWNEPMEPLIDLLANIGTTTEEARKSGSLQKAFLDSEPNRWIKAPHSLDHRYMHEDFGYGLVAMTVLAQVVGVETPIMDSIIRIGSAINDINYSAAGRTMERLGLSGMTREEIQLFIEKDA